MDKKTNVVVVNRDKNCFTATIGGKEIKMTFEEFVLMKKLLSEVTNDYEGTAYAAYLDGDKIITLRSK